MRGPSLTVLSKDTSMAICVTAPDAPSVGNAREQPAGAPGLDVSDTEICGQSISF